MQALLHFLVPIIRCAPALLRSCGEQAIVELALRQQLATYARQQSKPRLTSLDRVFWVALFRFWPQWKRSLVIVKPDTVVRWHRKGFGLYWRWISKPGPGRPAISPEVRSLIKEFACDNGCGGAGGACESKDSCGTRKTRLHSQSRDGVAVYAKAPPGSGKTAALDDISSQSQGWHCCDGLLCRAHDFVPSSICVVRDRPQPTTDHSRQRHVPSDIALDYSTTPRVIPQ